MISTRVLERIYQDYRSSIFAKGTHQALCYILGKLVERGDVKGLVDIGIEERVAKSVIKKVHGKKAA